MKTIPLVLSSVTRVATTAALWLLATLSDLQAAGRETVLEVIRNLENPRNLSRPGPRGELGPYQFRVDTWRMHSTAPFSRALDRGAAEEVAVRHYEWIRRGLEKAGMTASPYNVALAWNGGLAATVGGRAPRAAHRYAERAANLASVLGGEGTLAAAR